LRIGDVSEIRLPLVPLQTQTAVIIVASIEERHVCVDCFSTAFLVCISHTHLLTVFLVHLSVLWQVISASTSAVSTAKYSVELVPLGCAVLFADFVCHCLIVQISVWQLFSRVIHSETSDVTASLWFLAVTPVVLVFGIMRTPWFITVNSGTSVECDSLVREREHTVAVLVSRVWVGGRVFMTEAPFVLVIGRERTPRCFATVLSAFSVFLAVVKEWENALLCAPTSRINDGTVFQIAWLSLCCFAGT